MHAEPGLDTARKRTVWVALGRIAKFAAIIAAPIVALLVWWVPPPPLFGQTRVSIHVIDATKQYSPDDLELRGPGDETAYLDAGWTCTVDGSWAGHRLLVFDGRKGIELTSTYLRPDNGRTARIWIHWAKHHRDRDE